MSKKRGFNCPICDEIFSENDLENHVQNHFDDSEGRNVVVDSSKTECPHKGCSVTLSQECLADHVLAHDLENGQPTSNDGLLAMAIQNDENAVFQESSSDTDLAREIQKNENDQLEKEEFRKLQEKYGMSSNGGGFCQQFEKAMSKQVGKKISVGEYFEKKTKMITSVITGEDSNETRTSNIIPFLRGVYSCGIKDVSKVFLCGDLAHFAADYSDKGWGCGYRNAQMLLSSLLSNTTYQQLIQDKIEISSVPSVPKIQSCIESAWKEGFDASGCEQLGGKLSNSKKWIGATEVTSLLRWMNIRARIVDFHKGDKDNTHPLLFEWVENYFTTNSGKDTCPLYIQHQGHSRTIIGFEVGKDDASKNLLLFDPSTPSHKMNALKKLQIPCSKTQLKDLRKSLKQMKNSQFQLVFIDGIYVDHNEKNESKVLSSIRISSSAV